MAVPRVMNARKKKILHSTKHAIYKTSHILLNSQSNHPLSPQRCLRAEKTLSDRSIAIAWVVSYLGTYTYLTYIATYVDIP